MHRLIITSGPSCVGKSPLFAALQKFYPHLYKTLTKLVIFNSRKPRPAEKEGIDYYFRSADFFKTLKKKRNFIVRSVRGDLQALDVTNLKRMLKNSDVFFEGNPFIYQTLLKTPQLKDIETMSIFISPLSREEIIFFKNLKNTLSLKELVTDIMRHKLLRRTKTQKGILSLPDLENIEVRAKSAYQEMLYAHLFDVVLPNHDGEDSDNWNAFYYPIGEARKTLTALAEILEGKHSTWAQRWEKNLL